MVSDSFLRAPTEPGCNDLRSASLRATCPSSQPTALNSCRSNASFRQKSLQVLLPWPLPTTESSVQRPEAGHALVGSGWNWDSSCRPGWGDVRLSSGNPSPLWRTSCTKDGERLPERAQEEEACEGSGLGCRSRQPHAVGEVPMACVHPSLMPG